jgi:hypothetical protein
MLCACMWFGVGALRGTGWTRQGGGEGGCVSISKLLSEVREDAVAAGFKARVSGWGEWPTSKRTGARGGGTGEGRGGGTGRGRGRGRVVAARSGVSNVHVVNLYVFWGWGFEGDGVDRQGVCGAGGGGRIFPSKLLSEVREDAVAAGFKARVSGWGE